MLWKKRRYFSRIFLFLDSRWFGIESSTWRLRWWCSQKEDEKTSSNMCEKCWLFFFIVRLASALRHRYRGLVSNIWKYRQTGCEVSVIVRNISKNPLQKFRFAHRFMDFFCFWQISLLAVVLSEKINDWYHSCFTAENELGNFPLAFKQQLSLVLDFEAVWVELFEVVLVEGVWSRNKTDNFPAFGLLFAPTSKFTPLISMNRVHSPPS